MKRGPSMQWHSSSWLGHLALLSSDSVADHRVCLQALFTDHSALHMCESEHEGSLFLTHMCRVSPLTLKAMSDLCDVLTPGPPFLSDEGMQVAVQGSRDIFDGWGQSKVVEGSHREVREAEVTNTSNKAPSRVNAWNSQVSKSVIACHGRQEVDPSQFPLPSNEAPQITNTLFDPSGYQEPWMALPSPKGELGPPSHLRAAKASTARALY